MTNPLKKLATTVHRRLLPANSDIGVLPYLWLVYLGSFFCSLCVLPAAALAYLAVSHWYAVVPRLLFSGILDMRGSHAGLYWRNLCHWVGTDPGQSRCRGVFCVRQRICRTRGATKAKPCHYRGYTGLHYITGLAA